jgi:RNA polymerase sigma-70 factor, ECF subfamily
MNDKEFETLFKSQFSSLSKLAFTVVKDADVAKDIVQQVFIKFWHRQKELNVSGKVEAYLYRMVINFSLNHIEKEKKYTRLDPYSTNTLEQADGQGNDNSVSEHREYKIRNAISQLPPQCQTVFSLSRFENLSNKEIAVHLGVSVKTVEKHITVALKTLRIKLKPLLNSEMIFYFLMIKILIHQVGFFINNLS